jgi:hypothetical protein
MPHGLAVLSTTIEPHESCRKQRCSCSNSGSHTQQAAALLLHKHGFITANVGDETIHLRLSQGELTTSERGTGGSEMHGRHLMREIYRIMFQHLRKSLCAADARGAQRGCDGPPRRRGNKPGTGEQRHQLRHVIFVLGRDGSVDGRRKRADLPTAASRTASWPLVHNNCWNHSHNRGQRAH